MRPNVSVQFDKDFLLCCRRYFPYKPCRADFFSLSNQQHVARISTVVRSVCYHSSTSPKGEMTLGFEAVTDVLHVYSLGVIIMNAAYTLK